MPELRTQFEYRNGRLFAEDVSLERIAEQYGTPCYVYSRRVVEDAWRTYEQALSDCAHLICYAVKANSNLAVLDILARLGSGFDIVSGGELERVLAAGGAPARIVFSGVGKTADEITRALEVGIKCFNVESTQELENIDAVARQLQKKASISIRVNPDIDAKTHPYIATGLKENKFGIEIETAPEIYNIAAELQHVEITGIDCHIGSQITSLDPFYDAIIRMVALAGELESRGIGIRHINIGGGLGIAYRDENIPAIEDYIDIIRSAIDGEKYEVLIEPGRSIAGNAGVLLTRVEYLKHTRHHHFAIVDAAMNDLLRPALYNGWHNVKRVVQDSNAEPQNYHLVGPICETSDFLAKDRSLSLEQKDLLAIYNVGAYSFSMSSNYNSRPRACEVMVDGGEVFEIKKRETIDSLMLGESMLPD